MIRYNFKTKVYYKDVDQMGIVYYSRYFEYFEQARTEMFSSVGLNVTKVEEDGIHLPVISSHCDYKIGARFEDDLIIKTCVNEFPKSTLKIHYEVYSTDFKKLFALGYTIHAFLKSNGKPTRAPSYILSTLGM